MGVRIKKYKQDNVLVASQKRIKLIFDNFERIYCAFSGGKDSTILTHLVMEEAIKRNKKVGLILIDFEAQYKDTMQNSHKIFTM